MRVYCPFCRRYSDDGRPDGAKGFSLHITACPRCQRIIESLDRPTKASNQEPQR